jgi:hypothetical protein
VRQVGYIGGPRWDGFFFFGGAALAVAVGLVLVGAPAWIPWVWLAWLALVDGPHLVATWTRAPRPLALWSLVWLAPGYLALAATEATGIRAPLDLYLLAATLWGFHHAIRQHYGILAIYERHARPSPEARRLDVAFLYTTLWGSTGLFLVAHPGSRVVLGLPVDLPVPARALLVGAGAALGALVVGYVGVVAVRALRRQPLRPALFALGPAVGVQLFAFFVIGRFEPLLPHPSDPEQFFLAVAVVGGLVHGLQYLGVVFAANRRRHGLGYRPLAVYSGLVIASLAYVGVNLARGVAPVGGLFALDTPAARLFLVTYWGIFFHHYYIDQKIWRPHADAIVRAELGLS